MKGMKGLLVGLVALLTLFALAACGGSGNDEEASSSWLEEANLDSNESPEELYEKAKEEGEVTIYSMSSSWEAVKENFEKEYPGIEVKGAKLHGPDLLTRAEKEQAGGQYNADVILVKEIHGKVKNEFFNTGKFHGYTPERIMENLEAPYNEMDFIVPWVAMRAIFYNTDAYDEPPIENWWDLTTPEWEGKFMLNDPLASSDTMAVLLTIVQNHEDFEQAYEEKFGEELVLDGTENAGYELIKRIMENDPILTDSSSEIVKAVANADQEQPPVGLAIAKYMKDVKGQGYPIAFNYDLKPGISNDELPELYIADQAPNPNAAKLLIQSLAGGEDGQSTSLDPFNVPASFPTNKLVTPSEPDQPHVTDLNIWNIDVDWHYEHFDEFKNFWLKIQE